MKTTYILLLTTAFLFKNKTVVADSPLTSTYFSKAYEDVKIIQSAGATKGVLTEELMMYLIDSLNPIEIKIALINKLGWDMKGKNNSTIFYNYFETKYNYKNIDEFVNNSSSTNIICMAYLKALDNYFGVDDAISYAKKARLKNDKSYTINIVLALIEAQKLMNSNWCLVYRIANNVRCDTSLKMDMKKDAVDIIFIYMDIYKNDCL
jgi:hypothetical protein